MGWNVRNRARLAMGLAAILLIPDIARLWTAYEKIITAAAPSPLALSFTGLGALAINLSCAAMFVRNRHHSGSLTRAAFLSARNDASPMSLSSLPGSSRCLCGTRAGQT
jgi:Co/Zn/Cd efflux system component